MDKKTLKIIGVIVAVATCFPLHFLYDKFPNFLTSIFSPVNESIWEHMKILFGSIMFSGVVQKIIILLRKEKVNNICLSNFIAALSSIPIFLILFLPVYHMIGENFPMTIIIMIEAIAIAELVSYILMNKENFKLENKTIFFVIGVYIIFTILTYYPIRGSLFMDPTSSKYGIIK